MAEKRRGAVARRMEKQSMNPKVPMTKEQKSVTDWLKKNVPTKRTKFLHSHVVEYFVGSKAVDMLINESPWARDKTKELEEGQLMFDSREQCVEYLDALLRYKMFHRAKKIPIHKEKDQKEDKKKREEKADTEERESDKQEGKKEKKRKIRLDMHLDQMFVDCSDAYVWLYDPIPWYYWLVGSLIVLAVIGLCLFPLWPKKVRRGAHWIALAAAVFLGAVLASALLKYALFALLYLLSSGKLRFWILPNLTEDVGFLSSFWPLYAYTYTGEVVKDKLSDDEDEGQGDEAAREESDSNDSRHSSTGKDFEMIDDEPKDEATETKEHEE